MKRITNIRSRLSRFTCVYHIVVVTLSRVCNPHMVMKEEFNIRIYINFFLCCFFIIIILSRVCSGVGSYVVYIRNVGIRRIRKILMFFYFSLLLFTQKEVQQDFFFYFLFFFFMNFFSSMIFLLIYSILFRRFLFF